MLRMAPSRLLVLPGNLGQLLDIAGARDVHRYARWGGAACSISVAVVAAAACLLLLAAVHGVLPTSSSDFDLLLVLLRTCSALRPTRAVQEAQYSTAAATPARHADAAHRTFDVSISRLHGAILGHRLIGPLP